MEPSVVYADEEVLVVHKPPGILAAPGGNESIPDVLEMLRDPWGPLWVVQRLDRQASGALLLARTPEARRTLRKAFEAGEVKWIFHALVRGNPPWAERMVTLPLRVNVGRRKRSVPDPRQGKPARTAVRVIERFGSHALVEVRPITWRRHQIRAHLFALGHPIAGDPLYGPGLLPQDPLPFLALHARRVIFPHPATGHQRRVTVAYPSLWEAALDALRWEKALVDTKDRDKR